MKRDRGNSEGGVDEIPVATKLLRTDISEDEEAACSLVDDASFSAEGSYLVIVENRDGEDVEYHICTRDDVITVHDAQGRLLKSVQR